MKRAEAATDLAQTRTQWRFVPQTVSQRRPTPADQVDHVALLLAYPTDRATRKTSAWSRNAVNLVLDEGWTLQVERKSLCGDADLTDSLQARPEPCTLRIARMDTPLIGHLIGCRPLTPDALPRVGGHIFTHIAQLL